MGVWGWTTADEQPISRRRWHCSPTASRPLRWRSRCAEIVSSSRPVHSVSASFTRHLSNWRPLRSNSINSTYWSHSSRFLVNHFRIIAPKKQTSFPHYLTQLLVPVADEKHNFVILNWKNKWKCPTCLHFLISLTSICVNNVLSILIVVLITWMCKRKRNFLYQRLGAVVH